MRQRTAQFLPRQFHRIQIPRSVNNSSDFFLYIGHKRKIILNKTDCILFTFNGGILISL